jgi:hypothetical protein
MERTDRSPFGNRFVGAGRIGHGALGDQRHDRVDTRG